jgi:hypothetical protein
MMARKISSESVKGIFYYVTIHPVTSFFVKRRKLTTNFLDILLPEKTYQQLYYVHHDCFFYLSKHLGVMQQLETILYQGFCIAVLQSWQQLATSSTATYV